MIVVIGEGDPASGCCDGCETVDAAIAADVIRASSRRPLLLRPTATRSTKPVDDYPWSWNDERMAPIQTGTRELSIGSPTPGSQLREHAQVDGPPRCYDVASRSSARRSSDDMRRAGDRRPQWPCSPRKRENGRGESLPGAPRFTQRLLHPWESRIETIDGAAADMVVVVARLRRGQPLAEAGKRERVVAHRADVVLRLPETPALDARARVERVDDAPSEEVPRDRRRRDEEIPCGRWLGTRPLPSRRTAAGTVARRDGTEPPASSRGRAAARPAAGTPGRWSARARGRRAAPRRARR